MSASLVGSEMCIRDRLASVCICACVGANLKSVTSRALQGVRQLGQVGASLGGLSLLEGAASACSRRCQPQNMSDLVHPS
eukprot:6417271-Alexandrium_andersonii.AAC.1